ncbi:hypothetical protein N9F34_00625, partial [Alphaproteobacteria bacterium]|nr:hypothetical protein [Alphaproteobacteria bacterium]
MKRHADAEHSETVDHVTSGKGQESSSAETMEAPDTPSKTIGNETNNNLEAGHVQGNGKNDAQSTNEISSDQTWAITQSSLINDSPIKQAAAGARKVGTAAAQSPAMQTTPGTRIPLASL